jgi:hypothetical protein
MDSVAAHLCREPAALMPRGQSYEAELTVDRWQLSYFAGPEGISLGVGGRLEIGRASPRVVEVWEIHLCNGYATQRYFNKFKDIPQGAFGAIDLSDDPCGAIVVRPDDPALIYDLLELQHTRRLSFHPCQELKLRMTISATDTDDFFSVRSMHFYL